MCVYAREHPHGLLPGIANLYCLDGALRLQWMAEWPEYCGPCTRIIDATGDTLSVESASGEILRINAHTGRVLEIGHLMAAAG